MWVAEHGVPGMGDTSEEEELVWWDQAEDGKLEFEGEGGKIAQPLLAIVNERHGW